MSFLIWLLLSAPYDAPVPAWAWDVHGAVSQWCVAAELLDPRETRWTCSRQDCMAEDVKLLRTRYAETADAPPLCLAELLPTREACGAARMFNRDFRNHLEDTLPVTLDVDKWRVRDALRQCDAYYQVWDAAQDARTEYYYVTVRRAALKKLREASVFSDGMPPCVPMNLFNRLP